MAKVELPLIGLLDESVLPHETRTFASATLLPAAWRGLTAGDRIAAVTVATSLELPTYVKARWAALAIVLRVTDAELVLEGRGRARILAVQGTSGPYRAELQEDDAPPPATSDLVRVARTLLAALAAGARPPEPEGPRAVERALTALMRALSGEDAAQEGLRLPLVEAAEKLARTLSAQVPAEEASDQLELLMRQIQLEPRKLSTAAAHRLWSQCVEIMRRLDVYDPSRVKAGEDESTRLERRLLQAGLPRDARELADRELRLLSTMRTEHHDYSLYLRHLELMAELRWHPDPPAPIDLQKVAAALERVHTGLEKPKTRILEYLAVRQLGGTGGTTILCLVGPAGVGKTSIAAAIAEALGKKLIRVALGGVHDESELRGHRKSFMAAAPGRIIGGIARAGSSSAVMLLDELDKVGTDRMRSPVGALHEILDPEQNAFFHDNYLATPFDLSHLLFITTANDASAIPPTLRDRLELVELEGYTVAEKVLIAERHLLERVREETGLPQRVAFAGGALESVVEGWAREPGVRELKRALGTLYRRRALAFARGAADSGPIDRAEIERVLGPRKHSETQVLTQLPVGVSIGLAVSGDGGSILYVEVITMPGKGELRLTGRLGDVMKESAHAALGHLRATASHYGLDREVLEHDLHVHVPEGATPKDGPSAGVALVLAMWSALAKRPLPADLAATGEITLTGRVLAVGGVRAKLLAAASAGLRRVVIPRASMKDVPDGPGVEVVGVERVSEVLAELALVPTSGGVPGTPRTLVADENGGCS